MNDNSNDDYKVYIVGVLDDGLESLSPRAREIVCGAELLLGGERLLALFPCCDAERVTIKADVSRLVQTIRANLGRKRIVVLASGDPNFYGLGRHLMGSLPRERLEIIPNVSSMQLAFAKIKESWDDATLTSVHARALEDVIGLIRGSNKIGLFTDNLNTPAAIARALLSRGINGYDAYVCENLGGPRERVTRTDLKGLAEMTFSPVNVLILIRARPTDEPAGRTDWTIGIPDDEFLQRRARRGLITKAEVRVVSLSRMQIREDSTVWDIGAGSGSVGIEAALIARHGRVFAIEKNVGDVEIIRRNMARFRTGNMTVALGFAPEGLDQFEDPDVVFIGGTGGRMKAILEVTNQRLRPGGRIVVNVISLESLQTAMAGLRQQGLNPDVTLISAARTRRLAGLTALAGLDPVFIVSATKDGRPAAPGSSEEDS